MQELLVAANASRDEALQQLADMQVLTLQNVHSSKACYVARLRSFFVYPSYS
jgi:hypothetical protein